MSTIFALSSGALPSAIAIFRVSGPASLPVLRQLSRRQKWAPKMMEFTKLYDGKQKLIDEAMAVYFPGPRTFSGEDTCELYVHGSVAVSTKLAATLAQFDGVREAKRGEFTRRAFYNGKMNLSEVQGLDRLIRSQTEKEHSAAFAQMRGGVRAVEIRSRLSEILAQLYVIIDFGEHVELQLTDAQRDVAQIHVEMTRMWRAWQSAMRTEKGLDVVLYGRPNCGKSSLLNQLAHDDVAIVSPIAGTTRDSLVTTVQIEGVKCRLTDTAGIRSSTTTVDDVIEEEGIRRARKRLKAADLVLVVVDPGTDDANEILEEVQSAKSPDAKMIIVRNKSDLNLPYPSTPSEIPTIATCATSSHGVDDLRGILKSHVAEMCPETAFLMDGHVLERSLDELTLATLATDAAIVCRHVESAVDHIGELTRGIVSEEVLDEIFGRFCIGK